MQIAATRCEEAVASLLGTTHTAFWVGHCQPGSSVREQRVLRRPSATWKVSTDKWEASAGRMGDRGVQVLMGARQGQLCGVRCVA